MDDELMGFLLMIDTDIEGVHLSGDINNMLINLEYYGIKDILHVNYTNNEKELCLRSAYCNITYFCSVDDGSIDDFIYELIEKYNSSSDLQSFSTLIDDEEDVNTGEEQQSMFSVMHIEDIVSDLSVVVLSKLVYEDTLIGYRFRLNNGCLDISVDKGRELGIVPYKLGKRVRLSEVNGVYASNYECTHKTLFPDISSDDDLCRKLFEIVLSQ